MFSTTSKENLFSIQKIFLILSILTMPSASWCKLLQPTKSPAKPIIKIPEVPIDHYAVFEKETYRIFKTFQFERLDLSADCLNQDNKPKCLAYLNSLNHPIESSKFRGSPASKICTELTGINLIAFNHKKQEVNFCEFKDGSMVNSWTLYYKHYPKKYIN